MNCQSLSVIIVLCAVSLNGRPVIINPENFGSYCPGARITATYPFVDFLEDVLSIVFSDAFRQRR